MIYMVAAQTFRDVNNEVVHIFDFSFSFAAPEVSDGVVGIGAFVGLPIEVNEAVVVVWVNDGEQAFSEGDCSEWAAEKNPAKEEQDRWDALFEEDSEVK
jgi:hypothetical protein